MLTNAAITIGLIVVYFAVNAFIIKALGKNRNH